MAFNLSGLVVSDGVAQDFEYGRIWDYSTADDVATVDSGTYWDAIEAVKSLRKGDWVRVTASDGKGIYMVVSSTYSTPAAFLVKKADVSAFV